MPSAESVSIDWYRTPVDAELLQTLNQRDDRKGLIYSLGHLSVIAATFTTALLAQAYLSWPWLILAILVHGTVTKFAINAVHEFVHGTVFQTKWLNTLFCRIYSFIGWIHPHAFWASHTEHHKYTMHLPHDMEVISPSLINFGHFFRTCLFDWRMMPGQVRGNIGYAKGRFATEGWEAYLLQDDEKARRGVTTWARTLLLGHLAITVVSLYYGYWLIPILTSLTPAYGNLVQQLCNGLQHTGLPGEVDDFRLSCRTVRLNRAVEFLYWNMNFHTEHHMYAAVPFYNLPRLHEAVRHDLPPTHKGLARSWYEVLAILRRLEDEPDYRHMQKLPGSVDELPAEDNDDATTSIDDSLSDAGEPEHPGNPEGEDVALAEAEVASRQWECTVCGFIYDEALGLPDEDIPPGTAWDDIPDDWMCPDCGVGKDDFDMVEI